MSNEIRRSLMKIETIGGALIAAVILLVSNLMSLFAQDAELTFAMIGQATWEIGRAHV